MYAIRSYYAAFRPPVQRSAVDQLLVESFLDLDLEKNAAEAGAGIMGRRITSYNVCYTKLLRVGQRVWNIQLCRMRARNSE